MVSSIKDIYNIDNFPFGTPLTMEGILKKTAENKGFDVLFGTIK